MVNEKYEYVVTANTYGHRMLGIITQRWMLSQPALGGSRCTVILADLNSFRWFIQTSFKHSSNFSNQSLEIAVNKLNKDDFSFFEFVKDKCSNKKRSSNFFVRRSGWKNYEVNIEWGENGKWRYILHKSLGGLSLYSKTSL